MAELIPLGAFAMVAYVFVQYLHHRQRMKLIEKGMATTELPPITSSVSNSMRFGLIAIALGLAIFISQVFEEMFRSWGNEDTFAMGSIFVGAALIIHTLMSRKAGASGSEKENDLSLRRSAE
ncbi:hypothetical protein L6R21_14470 [bacterium]|nr:hypothetical protein [bacterium]